MPRFAGNDFIFAGRGAEPFNGGSFKAQFDTKCGVTGWTLHDLRRTARSLMSRAGVNREHAERVLGHVIGGVEGTYDRHRYDVEKAVALRKLADLITRIVNAPGGNVVELRGDGVVKEKKRRGRPRLPEDELMDAAIKRREARKREEDKRRRRLVNRLRKCQHSGHAEQMRQMQSAIRMAADEMKGDGSCLTQSPAPAGRPGVSVERLK